MQEGYKRCPRCSGSKKMYKANGGFSLANYGGALTDCPFCLGKGEVKTLETAAEEATKKVVSRKKKEETLEI